MYKFFIFLFFSTSFFAFAQGPIAKYEFNGNANDLIGSNNGTVNGATLVADRFGNPNRAYYFDGIDDFIEIPNNILLNFAYNDDFTITLWAKIAAVQNDLGGHNNEILGKWNPLNGSSYPYAIRYWNELATEENKNKIFNLRYDSPACENNPLITGSCQVTRDEWHHLVLVKNGNTLIYYQDGDYFGSTLDNTTSTCNTINSNPIYIGKRDSNRRYFTGAVDDIEFYNRALSLSNVNLLFIENGWSAPPPPRIEILTMSMTNQISSNINKTLHTVDILMPCYTNLKQLSPSFTLSNGAYLSIGLKEQISGITTNDFTTPVNYKIANELYCISNDWTVTAINQTTTDSVARILTSFTSLEIQDQVGYPKIDTINNVISIEVICEANINELHLNFSLKGNSVFSIADVEYVSGEKFNFLHPLNINLINEEACTQQKWTIKVTQSSFTEQDILHEETFFIPNVITPNKDGKNEYFQVGELLLGSSVTIVNRNGNLVYNSENYQNSFNGSNLSAGVYYYAIYINCYSEIIKGTISILR